LEIYTVGCSIESLQPPKGSEKVKRLGGPKYIKSRARDRKLKEWFFWLLYRLAFISFIYLLCVFWPFLTNKTARTILCINDNWFILFDILQAAFDFVVKNVRF
jgi:hypothetical protein